MPHTVIKFDMGQGVIADLSEYELYSPGFYSCMGVVFFEPDSKRGGLYHYPANYLKDDDVSNDLSMMMISSMATQAHVYLGGGDIGAAGPVTTQANRDDQAAVVDFLREESGGGVAVSAMGKAAFLCIKGTDAGLVVSTGAANKIDVNLVHQELPGDCEFYGKRKAGLIYKTGL